MQSEKLASIGILASGVAHEINNPLGGVFNCLQMLRQNGDQPELRKKYLDLVNEGFERIENTVSKLLWMSRKGEHAPVDMNIRSSVESVYSLLEYKLKKAKIAFRNEVDADLRFTFDVHDFQQLLLNLFINAIHAMENGGTLAVRGSRQNSAVNEDLYYRLNVIPIVMPPLRERREDIPALIESFLDKYGGGGAKRVRFTPEALDLLLPYDYPGNVRELSNLVERCVTLSLSGTIGREDLPSFIAGGQRWTKNLRLADIAGEA